MKSRSLNQDDKTPAYKYNLVTGAIESLPFKQFCRPILWRSATNQLFCSRYLPEKNYLIDLQGERMEELPIDATPGLYIPERDALLFTQYGVRRSRFWRGEICELWLYDFKTRKAELVQEDVGFGQGSAVWFENK